MAVGTNSIKSFDDWYVERSEDPRTGCLQFRATTEQADRLVRRYEKYKREMDARTANYDKLLMMADAEVISPKPDLPNVSSGETAGMIRRMARNLVQHTPNVDVMCEFDDESVAGIFARHMLKTKIIGDDQYSNDMQQNLFASTKNALTLGFDCVVPVLLQDAQGSWYMKYDSIYYRDVFPEPGARDVREANDAFVRRYLTKGQVKALIQAQPAGWDVAALKELLKNRPSTKDVQGTDLQSKKHHTIPEGYEVITWYSSSGDEFLTFSSTHRILLRIEKNKHPLKWHPVFFLVMEKDLNQPLGKSQVELVLGRQEFQDLLLNGAMKQYYRNINPSIIGYGTTNAIPNLGPGMFTEIKNPNARIETLEVSTQTLMQFGNIAAQNAANMTQLVGAADQQMAMQSTGGMMSQTPQGVEAQQSMVDITTNNYQKAIESFFSRYCSYALTAYFAELKGSFDKVTPSADARQQLINAGIDEAHFTDDGTLELNFNDLATVYYVRTVPGSLVELEDDKQIRLLNELFIPLSQAMPALANSGDEQALKQASAAMQYIVQKQLELSGSAHSTDLNRILRGESLQDVNQDAAAVTAVGDKIAEVETRVNEENSALVQVVLQMQEQMKLMRESQAALMQHVGIPVATTEAAEPEQPTVE